MKLSDYIVEFLTKEGISHIFELTGGAITHLLDSAYHRKEIHCVSVHHEQAAAFAAEAYARMNGNLGVAMATSGPGALNMVTGIGSCYFDSVPCLFITGQVNTYEYKFDSPVRQVGFQETDIVSVVKPLTKYAALITDAESIRYHLEKAVFLARSGRPGPVILDIPMNIQRAQISPENLQCFYDTDEHRQMKTVISLSDVAIDQIVSLCREAKRPVILAGGGVRSSGAVDDFQTFVTITGIPVVTSLMGLDSIPHDNPSFLGMIGAYGNRYSNLALANCDLVLILGSRLDSRQTGTRPDTFARAAHKIHVDIDPAELNQKVKADLSINCDLKVFLRAMNESLRNYEKPDLSAWYGVTYGYRVKYPTSLLTESKGLNPNTFMELLSGSCGEGDIVCLDVGQNQMWAAQSFRLKREQRMLISGGMGSMGFALPSAVGAMFASSGRRSIVITGDGGVQINIQELDTIANHGLPAKIFIMNNGCLGMVRQFQDMYFDGRHQSTVIGYHCPNLRKIAEAYGIPSFSIEAPEQAQDVITKALETAGPAFVNVVLDQGTNVNPKLVVNRPIEDMSPFLDKKELRRDMVIDILPDDMPVPK